MNDHAPLPRARQSNSQRAGRRFAPVAELALEDTARRACATLPGASDGLLLIKEFRAPYGVPDLVAVTGPHTVRRQRLRLAVPAVVNEIDACIVSVAHPPDGATVGQLAARLRWQVSTVERRLPDLLKSGAMKRVGKDRFARPVNLAPVGDFFAVEMKVSNWRRALSQCRTYRTWSNSYLLIMSRVSPAGTDCLKQEVAADGGGLVIGDEVLLQPRKQKLKPARRLWTSEHVILASRKGAHTQPSS